MRKDIIVIGTSAGGLETLFNLVPNLSSDLEASVFIIIHTSSKSPGLLAEILQRKSKIKVKTVTTTEVFQRGTIYVATPDRHLVFQGENIVASNGPTENRARPAVDPLFRSAAYYHRSRVIGVVLTGQLDDGSAGLAHIKRHGGVAIVQDPNEALFPSMPKNAIRKTEIDFVLPVGEMPAVLEKLVKEDAGQVPETSKALEKEMRIFEGNFTDESDSKESEKTSLTCPECGGPLSCRENNDGFRCLIGHSFSKRYLLVAQSEALEKAIWTTLRMFEEQIILLRKIKDEESERGEKLRSSELDIRINELAAQSLILQNCLKSHSEQGTVEA